MKILHIIRGLANSSGTTHIVGPVAEAQADLGHEVEVWHVRKGDAAPVIPDPDRVRSRCFPLSLPMDNPGVSLALRKALKSELRTFDVVHVHAIWNFPTWMAMRQAHRQGIPYVVAPQGSLDSWALGQNARGKSLYGRWTERPLFNHAACFQALTAKEAVQIRDFGIRVPIEIVPNGVPSERCGGASDRNPSRELGLPEDSFTLLFLSRLHPKKGLDLLVEAFQRLAGDHPSVHLAIAGGDAGTGYRATVERWVNARGLGQRVQFLGELKGEEKWSALDGADAFVLPSYSEGLPVAALEAMARGLPTVLTTECNLPEAGEENAAWVVLPDVESLEAGLRSLLAEREQALARGRAARELVQSRFTWPTIAASLVRVYEDAAADTEKARAGASA